MHSQKKRIRHRDRNYMIYVLAFLIMLTGMLGILKGSPVLAAEESTQKGSISLVCPVVAVAGGRGGGVGQFDSNRTIPEVSGLTGTEEPGWLAGRSGCTGGLYQT